jgi:multiple sugar transport system substrate-binding protein
MKAKRLIHFPRLFRSALIVVIFVIVLGITDTQIGRAENVQLNLFCWGLTEDIWGSYLLDMIKRFENKNPNIKVIPEKTTFGEKESVFTTRSEARQAPDVARFTYDPVASFANKGYLKDLTPFINQEPKGFLNQWQQAAIDVLTIDGHNYAMPEEFMPWVLIYNTEKFKQANLDPNKPPETREEFLTYAKALTRDTNNDGLVDQWGFGMIGQRNPGFYPRFNPWVWSAGGNYLTPDNKASALTKPETLDGTRFFIDLYRTHKVVPPGAPEAGPHEVRTQMAYEKIAMMIGTGFDPGIVAKLNPKFDAMKVLRMSPIPPPKGKTTKTGASLGMWVVSSQTKHPKEAWELIKFLTGFESQMESYRKNGWVSARKDVASSKEVASDNFSRVLAQEASNVTFPPVIVKWPEIGDIVITAIHNSLTQITTIEEAFKNADRDVNQVLAR